MSDKEKKQNLKIKIIILVTFILLIVGGTIIFLLIKRPKVTYEYYVNNIKSKMMGNNLTEYQCDNGTTLNIDKDTNSYAVDKVTKNSLCKIFYEDTAGEQLMNIIKKDEDKMYLDNDNNLYYYGENSKNYIYFNCENNDTSTCELWQIVSVTKVSDETKKNRYNLKIVNTSYLKALSNNQEITKFSWNNNRSSKYLESSIYDILNNAYFNSLSEYSYTDKDNNTINLDFSKTGLKNDNVRRYIADVTWRMNANTFDEQIPNDWISDTKSGNMVHFKIGLLSISDYLLSLKDECNNIKINAFGTCEAKSYLSKENGFFVLDSYQEKDGYVYRIAGNNAINAIYPTAKYNIYPTLYLNEDVKIISGDGSASNPYHLG